MGLVKEDARLKRELGLPENMPVDSKVILPYSWRVKVRRRLIGLIGAKVEEFVSK